MDIRHAWDIRDKHDGWIIWMEQEQKAVLVGRNPYGTFAWPEDVPLGSGPAASTEEAAGLAPGCGYHTVGEWREAKPGQWVIGCDPAELVNLTPHAVVIGGVTIPPAGGELPRVEERLDPVGSIRVAFNGVAMDVQTVELGGVASLPEPRPGTILIVSRMVAEAARDRRDLVFPVGQIRDEKGRIVGAAGLGRLPRAGVATAETCAIGWDEHGHARKTGLPIDGVLGRGELQDAENCGYSPTSVLAEMGVDQAHGAPEEQFRAGRIVLRDGTVLERGGTLSAVWAVTRLPSGV